MVKDSQGLVLPGVTVTLTGTGAVGERLATTQSDGSYRFPNLQPGTYDLVYELAGFGTLRRQGILVRPQTTITVNVTLEIATVAETITVTGESPVVDVKTTRVGGDFDSTALQETPSATDMWAVLAQSPGVRMRGYDVGGSHKSQQSAYETFGISSQVRVIKEGVNPTEGMGGAGGYWDYYNVSEYQVSAMGADVEMSTPGANIVAVVKSGGNDFSTLTHLDYTGEAMVTDNIDDELVGRGGSSAPVLRFYEFHTDLGGPIVTNKAWFYGSYNRFYIDRAISGQDPEIGTDLGLFHTFAGKLTWQPTEKDTFVGFSEWNRKQKPFRDLSLTVPPESVGPQHAWHWLHKAEWQRVWSDRMFSQISIAHFGYNFSQAPQQGIPRYFEGNPPRIDTATGVRSGPFWGPAFNLNRWKPHSLGQFTYYLPDKAGSHSFKFGWDWMIEGLNDFRNVIAPGSNWCAPDCSSGPIRYLDNSSLGRPFDVDEIALENTPTLGRNRNEKWDFYLQDTWTVNERLTVNLGVRIGSQDLYYKDVERNPDLTEFPEFFPTDPVVGEHFRSWWNAAHRLGMAWDVTGESKTIVKAYSGRYYGNVSTLDAANPGGRVTLQYEFLDRNENGIYDGRDELGDLISKSGGSVAQFSDDWKLMHVDEYSASFEREVAADLGFRVSYVRKQLRNRWANHNQVRANNLTRNISAVCTGCPGSFEGATLNLRTVPDELAGATGVIFAQTPDEGDNYDNIQFAMTRRMRSGLFVQGTFDYQWRDELRRATGDSSSPLIADPVAKDFDINYSRDVSFRQDTTSWAVKLLARYDLPRETGLSWNVRHQSGFPWAPIHRVRIENVGTQPIFLEDLNNNRSDNVTIIDFRIDKDFSLGGTHRITGMLDVYNLFNSNAENNFVLRTGSRFRNIIEWLPGRTLKLGIRYVF